MSLIRNLFALDINKWQRLDDVFTNITFFSLILAPNSTEQTDSENSIVGDSIE